MTLATSYSFDLNEEMVQIIEREYGPEALRKELRQAGPDRQAFFRAFGERWMKRTLELGENYGDRTYDVLKQVIAKTGSYAFPFLGERFVEIAYLGTQPIFKLPIIENSARAFVFTIPQCDFYGVVGEELGPDAARALDCKAACLAACRLAFEANGTPASVELEQTMLADGSCRFAIRPAS